MRQHISYLILFVCFSLQVQAQSEKEQLDAYVYLVQKAFDNNSDSIEYYAGKATPLAIKLKDINAEIKVQRLFCDRLFVNGQFDKATKKLLEVARDAEKYPTVKETPLLYYGITQIYSFNKYADIGEKYLRKGLAFAMEIKDDTILGNGYNRMGIMYERKGNLDSALFFYKQSLIFNNRANEYVGKAYSLENIAGIYAAKHDLASALNFQKQAMIYKQQNGKTIDIALSYINIAETFDSLKQYDSATLYAKNALILSRKINYRDLDAFGNSLLSEIFEKKGDYLHALEYHKKYSLVNDSIYTEKKTRQLAEINTKYQTEKHEQQIKELSQRTRIQNLELKQRNIFLFIAIGLIMVGSLIFYLVYNRRKLIEQTRLQVEINKQQNITVREVLNAEERERKRIAADLHDGVGQMLSATLINMDALFSKIGIDRKTNPQADRIFGLVTESYDELRAISHQMMPNALLKAGLGSAVKELVSNIDSNKIAISLEVVGLNERMNEEVETVLYRVIQESINNVIKHANAGKLNIQVIKDEDGVSVTIEDNGKGFDMKKVASGGIGLKNMYSRVQFQKGTVDIDSQPGKGTLVVFHIPLDATTA